MIGAFAALLLLAGGTDADCSAPDVFTEEFRKRAAQAYPDLAFQAKGELALSVRREGEEVGTVFLDTRHAACRTNPSDENVILDAYVAAVGSVFSVLEETHSVASRRESLVVVLRPDDYARPMLEQGKELAMRSFVGGLSLYLAEKRENTLSFVLAEDVAMLADSQEAAWTLAAGNIPSRITGVNVEDLGRGVFLVTAESHDAPSLLLHEAFWSQHGGKVLGRPTVYLADREHFLFTGDGEREGLRQLARARSEDDGTALTSEFYVRTDDGWVVRPE